MEIKNKNCLECGVKYTPTSGQQKYCSKCGVIHEKEREKEKSKKWREKHPNYDKEQYLKNKDNPKFQEKRKEWYEKNKDKIGKKHRKYREEIRKQFFEIYGKICFCCGEKNQKFLTLEHINNDGNKERKKYGGMCIYLKAIKEKDKTKYTTSCWNCNEGKRINKGICPHKEKWK